VYAAFLVRGLVVGFAIAAPVGPIGLLCIQRTLARGRRAGLVSGLGAASADAVYGFVAAFGLTLVATFLVDQRPWLGLGGGLFLVYLGIRTFRSGPSEAVAQAESGRGLLRDYASTFALTITNPVTILSFVAIFSGAGLAVQAGGAGAAATMVLGVFLGSAAWWLLLSGLVSLGRSRVDGRALRWINRGAGLVIGAFGFYVLVSLALA
jgi:threonine/homoserine/homoserine lactone efflux protein